MLDYAVKWVTQCFKDEFRICKYYCIFSIIVIQLNTSVAISVTVFNFAVFLLDCKGWKNVFLGIKVCEYKGVRLFSIQKCW